jgi:nitronate monooxygenase
MDHSLLPGLALPIIQAPMAGVQTSALALAVGAAGGLGSLPCAQLGLDAVRDHVAALDAAGRPYNVNFFCHAPPVADAAREARWRQRLAPYYAEFGIDPATVPAGPGRAAFDRAAAELLAAFRPPVVSFHFGLPEPELVAQVKAWGTKVMASATTVEEARWLEAHGADIVIAQGLEAGGHRGMFLSADVSSQLGTLALVPQIVCAVRVPVVAAGGIADARGVRAALTMGAAAAQIGTAYLLCDEATTTPLHRAALASDAVEHTALTNLFTGRPARGILNRLMRELGPLADDVPAFPLAGAALAPLRARAEALSRTDFTPLWSGQNARGCRAIGAASLTRALAGLD